MHAGQNKFSLKNFFSKYQTISRTCMKQSVCISMNQSSRINQQECVFVHRLCGWFQSSKSQSLFLLATSDRHNPVSIGHKLNVHKTLRRRPGRLLNILLYIQFMSCVYRERCVQLTKGIIKNKI